MAVRNGRITAVGTTRGNPASIKGPHTQVVDLGGRFVMPGFNDAHLHLANGGFEMLNVELSDTKSLDEMKARIAERVKSAAPGEWILGRGWDDTKWPVAENSHAAGPGCGHRRSSGALHPHRRPHAGGELGGAARCRHHASRRPIRRAGRIDRDADGEPAGGLRETAQNLIRSKVPPPTLAQRRRGAGTGAAGSGALRADLGAGQLAVGRLPHLRRPGKRRQADAAHHRVAAVSRSR